MTEHLDQAWGPSNLVVLSIHTGLTPVNLALDTVVKSHSSQKFPKADSTEIKHKLLPQPEKISGDYRDSNERRLFTSLPLPILQE